MTRYESSSTPDPELILSLRLRVREMVPHRPRRWAWDLLDSRDGSWFQSMFEFDSEEQAKRSGRSHLDEWRRSLSLPKPTAPLVDGATTGLVIVSADDTELFATLKRLLADGQRVEIIAERRKSPAQLEQRSADRRRAHVNEAARSRGWWIVTRDSAETA